MVFGGSKIWRRNIHGLGSSIVSRKSEEVYAERALHAGAAGYWMRTGSPEELLCAVEIVAKGGIYLSPTMAAVAIKRFARNNSKTLQGLDRLTDREITVLSPHCH